MFYNINSLLQSKYLLTTQLSLWSPAENIHSYVTQPSCMTCSTAMPPQTLCDLHLLAELQCLGNFLSTTRWQDQNTSRWAATVLAISKNHNTQNPDDKWDTSHFSKSPSSNRPGFDLSLWTWAPSSLHRPDLAISYVKLLRQFYSTRKSESSSSVPQAHTQPLPTNQVHKTTDASKQTLVPT